MMAAKHLKSEQMTLKQLLTGFVELDCLPDLALTGLSLDSRRIEPGNVFVALAGRRDHGLAYAEAAVNNGAVVVLCDRQYDQYCQQVLSALMTRVICVPVQNLSQKLGAIADRFYGQPSQALFTVGVTGTDGKTSVSHFIAQALDESSRPSAILGTVGNGLIHQLQQASHTTPDVIQVHGLLADYQCQGVSQVAMEVSSHGLDQGRVDGVAFDVAVLTNLGRDHLDYHGDLNTYRAVKRELFFMPGLKAAVLNLDDEFGVQLANELSGKLETWGYSLTEKAGLTNHLIYSNQLETNPDGLSMELITPFGQAYLKTALLGEFNASNIMATLAVLMIHGVKLPRAMARLAKLKTVPGRMQTFTADGQPMVVVDYAHTPQALGLALQALKPHRQRDLVCVFGCGGDRDQGKRPQMAEVAEQYADRIIVTDDNPRTEDGEQIIADILAGFKQPGSVSVIRDRKQAITQAIETSSAGDMILIAGKGHEDYQIVGEIKYPFSDQLVVSDCLERLS